MAGEVAHKIGEKITKSTEKSFIITVNKDTKKELTVRLMNAGSGNRPVAYFRVTKSGKGAYDATGRLPTFLRGQSQKVTHFNIDPNTLLDDIKKIIDLIN